MKDLATLLFLFFSLFAFSQGDEPCSAIPINCSQPAETGFFSNFTTNPDYPFTDCQGPNSYGGDVWFTFESDGIATSFFYSDTINPINSPRHILKLYSGETCETLTEVCGCNDLKAFHEVLEEGTYYVHARPKNTSFDNQFFSAGLVCLPSPPSNDDICNAAPISCGETVSGSLLGSTPDRTDDCTGTPGCNKGGDVWLEFEADGNTVYNIEKEYAVDILVYKAMDCNDELEPVTSCPANKLSGLYLEAGSYFMRVRPFRYEIRRALNYNVTLNCADLIENSLPCDAIEIVCGTDPITGSNVGASADTAYCGQNGENTIPQLWYKLQGDFEGIAEVYLCGVAPTFDARASVYKGSCDSLVCVTAGGNCTSGPKAFDVNLGEDYFIAVHGTLDSPIGEFSLTLQCEEDDFCPDLGLYVGDPCDDMNDLTYDDVVTSSCECQGTPFPDGVLCGTAFSVGSLPYSKYQFACGDNPICDQYDQTNVPVPPGESSCGNTAPEWVFEYTPPNDQIIDISLDYDGGETTNPWITVLTGCPFETAVARSPCSGISSLDLFGTELVGGTTYYILISANQIEGNIYDFTINIEQDLFCEDLNLPVGAPCDDGDPLTNNDLINGVCECEGSMDTPSDFCSSAVELNPGINWTDFPLDIDQDSATSSGDVCIGNESRPDSWFYFDAVATSMSAGVRGNGDFDPVVEAYTECGGEIKKCQNLTGEGGDEILSTNLLEIGERYYLRVYNAGPDPPANNSFRIAVKYDPSTQIGIISEEGTAFSDFNDLKFQIYPNPNSNGQLTVKVDNLPSGQNNLLLTIYDLTGRVVKSQQVGNEGETFIGMLPIEHLSKGVYLLALQVNGGSQSSRILLIE